MTENEFQSYQGEYTDSSEGKKKKKKSENNGNKMIIFATIAIVAAIIVFVVLTVIQNRIVKSEEKTSVVIAVTNVPKGIVLDQDTIQKYFKMELRSTKELPSGFYTSGHALVGTTTGREIVANEIVLPACLIKEDIYKDIEDPILVSIDVSKLSNAVGGTLRAGDYIDINAIIDIQMMVNSLLGDVEEGAFSLKDYPSFYDDTVFPNRTNDDDNSFVNVDGDLSAEVGFDLASRLAKSVFNSDDFVYSATGKYASISVAKKVRVVDVFTQAGLNTAVAEADGTKQVATVFTIVVPRDMEDMIYLAMEEGNMQISKVVFPNGKNHELVDDGKATETDADKESEEDEE